MERLIKGEVQAAYYFKTRTRLKAAEFTYNTANCGPCEGSWWSGSYKKCQGTYKLIDGTLQQGTMDIAC